jgi:uncharacterized protein YbaA (DUF1428 family)
MAYVDGFLLTVPKSKLSLYFRIAKKAGKIWKKCGALEYRECVGDDLGKPMGSTMGVPFPKAAKAKPGENVIFSWIVYKSRAHRDAVNKKVMMDPVMLKLMNEPMPFDIKRMSFGGFKVGVDL